MQLYQVVDNLNNQVVNKGKLSRDQVRNQVIEEYQVALNSYIRCVPQSSKVQT